MNWIYAIRKLANGESVPDDVVAAAVEELELMIMNSTTPAIRAMMIEAQEAIRNRDAVALEHVMEDASMFKECISFLDEEEQSGKYEKTVADVFNELIELTGDEAAAGAVVNKMVDQNWMLFYVDKEASVACFLNFDEGVLVVAIAVGDESKADDLAHKYTKKYVDEWYQANKAEVIGRLAFLDLVPNNGKIVLGISMLLRKGQ